MPNPNLTEIVMIVDRSGSMVTIQKDAEGGLNNLFQEQSRVPGEAHVTLVQFDTEYEMLFENKPLRDVPHYELQPRGATALLDAMAQTIRSVGDRLERTPDLQRPGKVVVVVVTDGEENSSKMFTREQVFSMVEHQRTKYAWEFMYLAANQDAIAVGMSYGIVNSMNFAAANGEVKTSYSVASSNLSQYRKSGVMDQLPVDVSAVPEARLFVGAPPTTTGGSTPS